MASGPLHSSAQPIFFLDLRTCSAALVAISNTSRTPSLVLAEHSKLPKALILLAISRPSSGFTGSCVGRQTWSSFLFPTRMMGTLGQKCFTSGVHFSGIFSVPGESERERESERARERERERERERRGETSSLRKPMHVAVKCSFMASFQSKRSERSLT
ncbi:hypothetical protein EYF80_013355 [Liparis tanakae]|uniref:Uncharacterized protein n=1 Tax=Liparis tanakae TaxID=230148 RepID=A0A4Z2IF22_9TELE|nr:hypothetical protein EYF80_013355 [Liparis tanakae]